MILDYWIVLCGAEASGLASLLSPTGWHLTADRTFRLWKDYHSPGFVTGAGSQDPGVDQPHQPGAIQQQSAW